MTTRDFTANVISATKVVPDGNFKTSKASGVWDINEALDLIKGGNWPNAANLSPDTFVDGLFSIDLIVGATGTARTINNGIDLSTKKGFVWGVSRSAADNRRLSNTVRGASETLDTGNTYAEFDNAGVQGATQFNSNGFVSGMTDSYYNNEDIVYWTFREQPKFFDLVQFSGTGSAQNISHSLGSVPGMIWVKRVDSTGDWAVYHRGFDSSAPEDYIAFLNKTDAIADNNQYWNDTAPTSSVFTVGTNSAVNASGGTYIAFIFAHNNDDGGFGEPGDQDIIKCGSFSTDSSGNATVNLGFEPQWLMVKATNQSYNWEIYDQMRGFGVNGHKILIANSGNAEGSNTTAGNTQPTSTGFSIGGNYWGANVNLIYMAIRRGGMQTPTAATDVFAIDTGTGDHNASFPIDFTITKRRVSGASTYVMTRLTGDKYLATNSTSVEGSFNFDNLFDDMTGVDFTGGSGWYDTSDTIGWMWKRARGFCDVVTYTGSGSAQNVTHNLGAVPEMMWFKRRDIAANWTVYHKSIGNDKALTLNDDKSHLLSVGYFNSTTPTSSVFSVGENHSLTNNNTNKYICYLFTSLSGVSKVGGYTGTGNDLTIDCGFSSGAKFVLIKREDRIGGSYGSNGDWYVYDSDRGIVSGNDPFLILNDTDDEVTNTDYIDPHNSGFTVTSSAPDALNASGGSYIFYAIAT